MRNVPKEIRELLKEVSCETGLDYGTVEDIYFHEFDFVARQIAKGTKNDYPTFENILVKHFGSFVASEKHVNKLKEITENNDREVQQG